MSSRYATLLILGVLVLQLEIVLAFALRWFGWYLTGNLIQFATCLAISLLPLVLLMVILARVRISMRGMLAAVALIGVFLAFTLAPVIRHHSGRRASRTLAVENMLLIDDLDWNQFYRQMELQPSASYRPQSRGWHAPWLHPFTTAIEWLPADDEVRSVWLQSDEHCRILAANRHRLPALQSIQITPGVTLEGFEILQKTLPDLPSLDSVRTNDVSPPRGWYASLTRVRTLMVWGEGASQGTAFNREHLEEITGLPNLEVVMFLGYAFDDEDAEVLAGSRSLKRVVLRRTAVTEEGELQLTQPDRIVYRN